MADNTTRFYDSFDALMQEEGITVLYPQNLQTKGERSLRVMLSGETLSIVANYEMATFGIDLCNIVHTEEQMIKIVPEDKRYEINGRIYYDLSGEGIYQLDMFDGEYLYSITANNHADLLAFAQLIE